MRQQNNMVTIINEGERESALRFWRGANAQLWMYHASLKRMALRLFRQGDERALFVVGVGCTSISGPFTWNDVALELKAVPGRSDGFGTAVVDSVAGFELRCDSVSMVEMSADYYPESFEHFLDDQEIDEGSSFAT